MRIQYMSDLHFEFRENSRHINITDSPDGRYTVLAGDIFYLKDRVTPFGEFLEMGF